MREGMETPETGAAPKSLRQNHATSRVRSSIGARLREVERNFCRLPALALVCGLAYPHCLDVGELADAVRSQFAAVAGSFNAAKRDARI